MNYPLAHDENGTPLDVPGTANGWLVRRHAGGRGRPAAVYDGDGRPLVVALDATAQELGSHGCRPGIYRLDAVDSARRSLGVVAYTEVRRDGFHDDESPSGGPSDAAVAALARAVEAMQRVQAERERAQAERERAQAEMIARLVERLAPPPPASPRNAPELLREFGEVQRQLKKLAPDSTEEEVEESESPMMVIAGLVQQLTQQLMPLFMQKMNGAKAAASPAVREVPAAPESEPEAKDEPLVVVEDPEMNAKIKAVTDLLTPEEAEQVQLMGAMMPPAVVDQAMQRLIALSPEEAVAEIRRLFMGVSPQSPDTGQAASPEVKKQGMAS